MGYNIKAVDDIIESFKTFPGIGPRSAQKLMLYFLKISPEEANSFLNILRESKSKIHFCSVCRNFTEKNVCKICSNPHRNDDIICVVEEPKDVLSVEKTGGYKGVYHVLMGKIAPLEGIGPENLVIDTLLKRVKENDVKEIILATSSDVEGEATAMYLLKLLKPYCENITRIAYGIPVGTGLDFADEVTLLRSFEGRKKI